MREIMDDRQQGKNITKHGKKPHIDMVKHAPTNRSQYRANYPAIEIRDILIEAQPKLPRY